MVKKAIIAGASGLIGGKLVEMLLAEPEYGEVLILVRKKIATENKKLTQLVVDFERLDDYAAQITGDVIFCCLGTTRKKTPDRTEYRKIDHSYPLQLAQIANANGTDQYHLVSAIGADVESTVFYTKLKGEVERDIKQVGLLALYIYQPSLLTGKRNEKRLEEKIAGWLVKVIDPLLIGSLRKYRSIKASSVAQAMVINSLRNEEGVFIYPSDKIKDIK